MSALRLALTGHSIYRPTSRRLITILYLTIGLSKTVPVRVTLSSFYPLVISDDNISSVGLIYTTNSLGLLLLLLGSVSKKNPPEVI